MQYLLRISKQVGWHRHHRRHSTFDKVVPHQYFDSNLLLDRSTCWQKLNKFDLVDFVERTQKLVRLCCQKRQQVEATFDFVARNVRLVAFRQVASTSCWCGRGLKLQTLNFVHGLVTRSTNLQMTNCPLSGCGQGHVTHSRISHPLKYLWNDRSWSRQILCGCSLYQVLALG